MHGNRLFLLLINLVGGIAVIGSYLAGFSANPQSAELFWGGVPAGLRPIYTTNMILAAIGYFAFTGFILFALDPERTWVADRFRFNIFNVIYAGILLPSALWMPLTNLAMVDPNPLLVWIVRFVLLLVALASVGLLLALLKTNQRAPTWAHRLALIGTLFFCFQTVILDAAIWGILFNP